MVRTSESHPIRVDWLEGTDRGRVGMTFAPGKRSRSTLGYRWDRDLGADLGALQSAGATVLVCLLEEHELATIGIPDLVGVAKRRGFEMLRLPIVDQQIPRDAAALDALLDEIAARVHSGDGVVIFCHGGLGRTGVIAGCWLRRIGLSAEDALATLRTVRDKDRCPENYAQREFVATYLSPADRVPKSTR